MRRRCLPILWALHVVGGAFLSWRAISCAGERRQDCGPRLGLGESGLHNHLDGRHRRIEVWSRLSVDLCSVVPPIRIGIGVIRTLPKLELCFAIAGLQCAGGMPSICLAEMPKLFLGRCGHPRAPPTRNSYPRQVPISPETRPLEFCVSVNILLCSSDRTVRQLEEGRRKRDA